MNERRVIIVSGLPYSGKSSLVRQLLALPVYTDAVMFSQDIAARSLYGEREEASITASEHVFKNEWMRCEILRALVGGTESVLVDSVMLTRRDHQRPMLEMIARAEQYVRAIASERYGGNYPVPSITVKVILCFASPDVLESRRLSTASEGARKRDSAPLFDLAGMWGAYRSFEFPDASTYEPLFIDTSDVSSEAQAGRMAEIEAFVRGEPPSAAQNDERRRQALASYTEMHAKVRQAVEFS